MENNNNKGNGRSMAQRGDEGGDYVELSPRRHPRLEDTPGILMVSLPPVRYALGMIDEVTGVIRLFNPNYFMDFNYMVELYVTLADAKAAKRMFLQHSDVSPDSVVIVKVELS